MEEDCENHPILAESHFYWGSCFVCKKKSSKLASMKRCTRCKSVYYCSQEHQKQNWKKHKKLCNYLAAASQQVDQFSFFSGVKFSGSEQWKTFRMNAVITCEIMFGESLSLAEKEIFLFPRACRVCRQAEDVMFDCVDCYCLSYCSEQHRDEDAERHARTCRALRICMLADVYESCVSVGLPVVPSAVDNVYYGTAPDITHFIPPPSQLTDDISKSELDHCFLTCQVSGALTILDNLHKFKPDSMQKETLVIHVVGATVYEMMGLIKWEYLLHRLPDVKEIRYSFIGPGLMDEENSQPSVPVCDVCHTNSKYVSYSIYPVRYSIFKNYGFEPADVLLVQNAGFSEFPDTDDCPGWTEGWSDLAELCDQRGDALLIFTAYTKGEADKDLDRWNSYCESEVVVAAQENAMKSLRPCRDWENDDNKDVFYANQYLSVVRKKQ